MDFREIPLRRLENRSVDYFVCHDIQLTISGDDAPKPTMRDALKDLGTIAVKFVRCQSVGILQKDLHNGFESEADSVSEKSLKGRAISNQTK